MSQTDVLEKVSNDSKLYSAFKEIGTLQRYRKDEIIYLQDDEAQNFYLLKSGRVKLFLTSANGMELTVKILGTHHIFGDASYFSKSPRLTSATALTDIEVLSVELKNLLPLLSKNPCLIAELLDILSQTIRVLSTQMYSMAFLSAEKKVAHILVQLGSFVMDIGSNDKYTIEYTHQDLAELVGLARVTTTKELKKFEKQGWIELDYRKIHILDEESLKRFLLS
ncbi:Crp/Fnr family transcriptional regulator [Niallia sp. Krafla_26]|uniref:Crp/Fnr family transcriptional regulator n=1 Tax=Niallia sp. Krafla_26 TaxID=3064703 RepID=UPI003D170482